MYFKLIDCKTSNTIFEFTRDEKTGNHIINKRAATHKYVPHYQITRLERQIEDAIYQTQSFGHDLMCDYHKAYIRTMGTKEERLERGRKVKDAAKPKVVQMDELFGDFEKNLEVLDKQYNFKSERLFRLLDGFARLLIELGSFIEDTENKCSLSLCCGKTMLEVAYM